jgi:hypothetical protein
MRVDGRWARVRPREESRRPLQIVEDSEGWRSVGSTDFKGNDSRRFREPHEPHCQPAVFGSRGSHCLGAPSCCASSPAAAWFRGRAIIEEPWSAAPVTERAQLRPAPMCRPKKPEPGTSRQRQSKFQRNCLLPCGKAAVWLQGPSTPLKASSGAGLAAGEGGHTPPRLRPGKRDRSAASFLDFRRHRPIMPP